jgi:hypothetical protein
VQLLFLPTDERFYVRITEDGCARFPGGAFSTVSNYPVYALRVYERDGQWITDYLIPASDAAFYWVDMSDSRLARRG